MKNTLPNKLSKVIIAGALGISSAPCWAQHQQGLAPLTKAITKASEEEAGKCASIASTQASHDTIVKKLLELSQEKGKLMALALLKADKKFACLSAFPLPMALEKNIVLIDQAILSGQRAANALSNSRSCLPMMLQQLVSFSQAQPTTLNDADYKKQRQEMDAILQNNTKIYGQKADSAATDVIDFLSAIEKLATEK